MFIISAFVCESVWIFALFQAIFPLDGNLLTKIEVEFSHIMIHLGLKFNSQQTCITS